MLYYVIAAELPEGFQEGPNVFTTATTRDGRRVCAKGAVDEFPSLFYGQALTLVSLSPIDFPPPPVSPLI